MPDYEMLYHALFNKVTHVIEELQTIQQVTEEIYITTDDDQDG